MRIVTINGSARPGNYTSKALALAEDELWLMDGVTLTTIDPAGLRLAIPGATMDHSDSLQLRETVTAADGVILATPEYHGSFSSLMKLVIENLGFPSALKGKPIVLLGVAAGRIGAIKSLEHLRSVCTHVGGLVLPRSISIARVKLVFDPQGNCLDERIEAQVRDLARDLMRYLVDTRCPETSFEGWARRKQGIR